MPTQLSLRFDVQAYFGHPAIAGSAAHAMFFRMLRQSNFAFSKALHKEVEKDVQPFSLDISSLLTYLHTMSDCERCVPPAAADNSSSQDNAQQQAFILRAGFLNDDKASTVYEALAGLLGESFRLETLSVCLSNVEVCSKLSLDELTLQVARISKPSAFTVHFKTPTVFRRDNHYLCLPLSDLLFADLSRRMKRKNSSDDARDLEILYRTILPAQHEKHLTYIEELYQHVLPDRYTLHTDPDQLPVKYIGNVASGFLGTCTYRVLLPLNALSRQVLSFLLSLMPYTGVGVKTAMGLGAVDVTS